ncbi:hypothetical protein ACJJTC_010697, partial [Scirpophaga incertulas]
YNGVAGCGTTKKAIDIVKQYPDDCLVLTATRSAAADLRMRISESILETYSEKELKLRFRTLDFLLVCMSNFKDSTDKDGFKILIIDECYMMNLGGLLAAMVLTNVVLVVCIGDRFQLPYIERDRMVTFQYDDLDRVSVLRDVFNVSSRCPADVCEILTDVYSHAGMKGMVTTNRVCNSIDVKPLLELRDISENVNDKTVVLTFKQEEKQELLAKINNVNILNCFTIHEFQGRTSENVILVRLSHLEMDEIYSSANHQLVALTRHTVRFVYYTRKLGDSLCKRIKLKVTANSNRECWS